MTDVLAVARELLPSFRLSHPVELPAGDRSAVLRARAEDGDGNSGTVIVKHFQSAGESWVREVAALQTLPAALGAPRVLASSDEPPLVVMTDVGSGKSLADALLGKDPQHAADALTRWAEALAAVHVATRDRREKFQQALDDRAGDLPVHAVRIGTDIDDAMRVLDLCCGRLGVHVPAGAFDEVRDLSHRLGGDADAAAMTPADTCPDDNVVADDGTVVIVDYENAQWRHIAWDVAYLQVPWPTCWCSWQLPSDVIERARAAYWGVAGDAFPELGAEQFALDLDAAAVGWSLVSTSWLLEAALASEQPLSGRAARGPTRRAMVLSRLQRAGECHQLPAAAELAATLANALRDAWGDVPLQLAPAFR